MSPQVTVLMSVYNGEKYLRESIDSILNQTYHNFEFIIIDDGSTDASREIIISFNDPRIILIANNKNIGLSKSLNKGIHQAQGKYIARQDADDVSHLTRIEKEFASIQRGNQDIVYCRYQYLTKNGKRLSWVSPMISEQSLGRGLIELKDPIAHGSVLMKKESLIDVGGYNELFIFSQDYELWMRLLSYKKKFKCIDNVGYYQRLLSQGDKIKRNAQRWYTTKVIDHYANNKKMSIIELTALLDKVVSSSKLQQYPTASTFKEFFYYYNLMKIQIRGFLINYAISSHQFRTGENYKTKILMITGAYYPEVNGAANQCRHLVTQLTKKTIDFKVLTTTRDPDLLPETKIDGVDIFRVFIEKKTVWNYLKAFFKFTTFIFHNKAHFQIIHFHGFSLKSALIMILSKFFHKKVIVKMTLLEHDDPKTMKKRGFMFHHFFSKADIYIALNPRFRDLYRQAQLPLHRLKQIPNGVDKNRFRPRIKNELLELRKELGLPMQGKVLLFVGHWSRSHKAPDMLFKVWKKQISKFFPDTVLVFIGSMDPHHFEVDGDLVENVLEKSKPYIGKLIFFVEKTLEIEKYYQASDVFVLPSNREGLPNVLLEAMACGLPVVASNLNGITDWIIKDGKNGFLFEPGDSNQLGEILLKVLDDDQLSQEVGLHARETVIKRFSMDTVANSYFNLYKSLVPTSKNS
tara:strand:+ start:704 stop:2770 length:2067 start_codon:yes stop_codon:yes gene_type:complete